MNKVACLVVLIIAVTMSGCSGSEQNGKEQIASLTKQLEEQSRKSKSVEEENLQLKAEIENLKSTLDEINNGADRTIIEIRRQYELKNYDSVMDLSKKLHDRFQGTPEDKEAQQLIMKIETVMKEEEQKKREEEAKKEADQRKFAQEKARSILRVSKLYPSEPNSAGGVDFHIGWKNNSEKIIKYILFTVEPYNAVHDVVASDIGGESTFRAKDTGPFKKGQGNQADGAYWENAWYNTTIKYVKLLSVEIEYMDGTTVTVQGDDLKHIQY